MKSFEEKGLKTKLVPKWFYRKLPLADRFYTGGASIRGWAESTWFWRTYSITHVKPRVQNAN